MLKNKRWNSIIEVMVVIIILTSGIIGTYKILSSGQNLSIASENRIRAINIAREWIEAVENIRDTNWIKFSSDYDNCWRVKDYNAWCIGVAGQEFSSGSYVLVQSGTLWTLSGSIVPLSMTTAYSWYIMQFPVYLDANGLTANSGSSVLCSSSRTSDCRSIFSREIKLSYPDNDHMKVNSIVTWRDSGKSTPYNIDLETVLTNWKKKF